MWYFCAFCIFTLFCIFWPFAFYSYINRPREKVLKTSTSRVYFCDLKAKVQKNTKMVKILYIKKIKMNKVFNIIKLFILFMLYSILLFYTNSLPPSRGGGNTYWKIWGGEDQTFSKNGGVETFLYFVIWSDSPYELPCKI